MMKFNQEKINALVIRLQGIPVGVISRLAGDRHVFSFEQDYIDNPSRPTLSLSFKGQENGLVSAFRAYQMRLPPFFSNLLPEGHMREYLARQAGVKPEREFFLLAALGADLPGALTAIPLEQDEGLDIYPGDEMLERQSGLHFSLAGIQLKFSAMMSWL